MTAPIHTEDHAWLARVDWVSENSSGPFGNVRPVARRDEEGRRWTLLTADDAAKAFPDRGAAFWASIPPGVRKGDLVVVYVERNRGYDAGKEAYLVQESRRPRWAYEVVDLRALEDERAQRVALTQEGLSTPLVSPHVYVRITHEEAIGPLELHRQGDGRFALDPQRSDLLQVVRLVDGDVAPVSLEHRSVPLLLNPDRMGTPVRYVNWASDADLAKSVLRRLLKLDRKAAQALGVAKDVFEAYVDAYPGFDFQNELQRRQEHARFVRLQELVRVVESDQDLLDRAARALVSHPAVAEALEEPKRQAVEDAREEAEREIRREAEAKRRALEEELAAEREEASAALAEAHKALAEAEASLEPLEQRRRDLQEAIDAAEAHLGTIAAETERRVADAEAALSSRLAELAARPAEAFAELAVVRALLPTSVAPAQPPLRPPRATRPPETAERVGWDDGVTGQVSKRMGAPDHYVSPSLLAAFLTGRPVVVAGDAAPAALHAVASVVAGGRMTWVPVAPTISSAPDLLTLADPATGRVLPHPGGLLDAILAAAATDEMALVVLEGFDRAACDHYLDPLLQVHADAGGGLGRTLPYLDPSGAAQRIAWPPNLLLACVPSGGTSALPPGPSFWKRALLVDAGDEGAREEGASTPTVMTFDEWSTLLESSAGGEAPELACPLGASPAARRSATALYGRALALAVPEHEARRIAFVGAVLPNAEGVGDHLDQALAHHVPDERRPRVRHLFDDLLSL